MVQLGPDPFSPLDSQSNGPPWKYQVNDVCYRGKINCLLNSMMNTLINRFCDRVYINLGKRLPHKPLFVPIFQDFAFLRPLETFLRTNFTPMFPRFHPDLNLIVIRWNLPESPSHVFSTFSPLRHIWVIGLYIRYMLWQTSWFSIDKSAFLRIDDNWSSWWSDWVLPHPITLLVDFIPH